MEKNTLYITHQKVYLQMSPSTMLVWTIFEEPEKEVDRVSRDSHNKDRKSRHRRKCKCQVGNNSARRHSTNSSLSGSLIVFT